MAKLEDVFNVDNSEVSPLKKEKGMDEKEIKDIIQFNDDVPATIEDGGKVGVTVDAKRAAKLNEFIQVRLAKIYEHAENAAEILCRDISHGDVDARVIEGTARLLETSIRALTEMNQFNMFLQKKIADDGVRREMEKLHEQMRGQNVTMSREQIMRLAKEIKADDPVQEEEEEIVEAEE